MSTHLAIEKVHICCSERAENTQSHKAGAVLEKVKSIVEATWTNCSRYSLKGKDTSLPTLIHQWGQSQLS